MELSDLSIPFNAMRSSGTPLGKCWLSEFGVIEVKGEDAPKFLQNLVTSDVRLTHPGQGQFSSWCDGKGRIQATFWILPFQDAFYLVLPQSMVAGLLSRLRMFVLRARVSLRDASEDFTLLGAMGVTPSNSKQAMETFPVQSSEIRLILGCAVMALPGAGEPRFLILGESSQVDLLSESLLAPLPKLPISAWLLGDIVAGIPIITGDTSGEFIPQMVSLEPLGALSFKKGCYPGQEIVARLQYRGQLKRKLFQAIVDTPNVPGPGTRLASPISEESVGQVLTAERLNANSVLLHAVVIIDHMTASTIHLGTREGPVLHFDPSVLSSESFRTDAHAH